MYRPGTSADGMCSVKVVICTVSVLCESCTGFKTPLFRSQLSPLTVGQKPKWVTVFLLVVSPHKPEQKYVFISPAWISLLVSLAEKVSKPCLS